MFPGPPAAVNLAIGVNPGATSTAAAGPPSVVPNCGGPGPEDPAANDQLPAGNAEGNPTVPEKEMTGKGDAEVSAAFCS